MKILALEFSSPVRGAAVSGGLKAGYAEEAGGRETKPFALIDAALREAGMTREEVECIAVGVGPGSNAGVRTAIAIAQGWQLARGVKLVGMSSAGLVAAHAGQLGVPNPVHVGLMVRPGELWVAGYDASIFEQPKLVEPFRPVSAAEANALSIFHMDSLPSTESADGYKTLFPNAGWLATLAGSRTDFVRGETLEPISLRPVQFVKAPPPKFSVE
jgi:tRNA threonylcarbamoyl adenosine modification protein YeaZ